MPIRGGCMKPHALAYFSLTCLSHVAQKSRGKLCQCAWLHATARVDILFPILCKAHQKQKPAKQCPPASSSIQLNLARLGLDGLSAAELAKLGWAPDVACGHIPLLLSSRHPAGTVSCHIIYDITLFNDVWGGG